MEFLAYHDYMTGLPNRRMFDQTLNGLFEDKDSKRFAIMYLDLDRFKHINDTLGHPIGDQLLKEAAGRIKASIPEDHLAFRMGGDEFAIIAPDTESIEDGSRLAADISHSIQKSYYIEGYELFITASIGISLYPNNGSTPEELARNADAALYHAKQMGKNSHQVYNSSMNIESFKKYCLERDMRNALKEDQFYVEFQPKIQPKTHKLAGAEALLRWNHPDWGIVSPMEFIPVAEESGLIVEIGDWVIENVISRMEEWRLSGLTLVPISINVSGQRFYKNNLAEMIRALCQKHGIPPELLELELTESSLIQYSDQVLRELEMLGHLKIKLSLDDFGTGFSSLTHLRKFKFNTLKIDKSFTKNITSNLEDATITSSLIDMAHGLNMKVVAEGVEEYEQLDFLKKKGCDEIQGFLFSRPVSGSVFRDFLKEGYIQPGGGKGLDKLKKQRKYFRIDLPLPLSADLTIIKLKDKQVEMGKNEVLIENIGPGGARLYTNIKLPIRQDILFQIQTKILGEILSLDGHIVWKEEKSDLVTQYGLEFSIDDKRREELTQLLNEIQGEAGKTARLPDSRQIEAVCPVDYFC
ncbi:EAL domain-containing protein [Bacillus infantis]|uniref:EAL domain-containing protein n=1 Tax=Bacillus infantis TaxID=324767 RepID=UPI003CFAD613